MSKTAWEPAPIKEGICGSCKHLNKNIICKISYTEMFKCMKSGRKHTEFDACDQSIEGKTDMDDQLQTLGSNIKFWLEVRGISQRELAERIDITEVSISRYVAGQRAPSSLTLCKISKVLGCTMEDLLSGCNTGRQQ